MLKFCWHDWEKVGDKYTSIYIDSYYAWNKFNCKTAKNRICLKCGKFEDNVSKIKDSEKKYELYTKNRRDRREKAEKMLDNL